MTSLSQDAGPTHAPAANKPVAAGSSFYTALRILPAPQREAMYQVYAFCRAVDDVADEGGPREQRFSELAQWRREVEALYASGAVPARLQTLAGPITQFELRKSDFLAVIDGMEMDVDRDIQAPDWAELDLYCDRVASAVGRLSVKIFGIDDDHGITLAHHLGRALQLTNILRDLDEDASIGRLYLPREELARVGITATEPCLVLADPNLNAVCAVVADRAREHFSQARAVMARCPRATTKSPRLMAAVYGAILDRVTAQGWAPPRTRVSLPKHQIILAILKHGIL